MSLRRGGVMVAIRIWYGPPLDPIDGSVLDRSYRWMATANERVIDFDRVWPACIKSPIDEAEYQHLIRTAKWAERNAPDGPHANPTKPVDHFTAPLPF